MADDKELTIEDVLELIRNNDSAFVAELYSLFTERKALKAIVQGAMIRRDSLSERYGNSDDRYVQGAVKQAEYDAEAIGYALDLYEIEFDSV